MHLAVVGAFVGDDEEGGSIVVTIALEGGT
jgi:hypothetical protein